MLASFLKLKKYCEQEGFKGWDPYDGLNSKVFQALPWLKQSALCRLIVIQGFKRCPINLRHLALVPKEYNAKGIGLFLQGYCNLYRLVEREPQLARELGSLEELRAQIKKLADLLLELRSQGGYSGACWGYNFDWQARRLFLFPKYTPTVVATNFCATALIEAYEVTREQQYLDVALSAAQFVIKDLQRTPYKDGVLFSYSPLEGNDTVFNASLLGARLLSFCYHYTKDEEYRTLARQTVSACCEAQAEDGSWVYGMLPVQSWVDSFHTGYNLDALIAYQELTGDASFAENIERGLSYYLEHFFEQDGMPKYYHNRTYPIDIHCPGQLFVSLARLHCYGEHHELANRVMDWTISNMQDKKGYFYYQMKPGLSSKIPYMRWSNAFMFYAMSYYLLNKE
ncbi:delta-aminolevulinic acid dehydratase [Porphyromonas sp. COT-290 OH860]|uniref:delta-aminolevulinic acid dehydratase n=1 Tax=Porphyromonas sp. COT-290 OH860 TaxID=1515615 RepID=UPI00052E272E|nr:delta-aminolevulinic acid dehydratase [Porphyromonas sp. COT-290 OH860]KGN86073.1 delta-aminolevulinic acid dehydratase [Porphyromonas sp. COT-290 OH860]